MDEDCLAGPLHLCGIPFEAERRRQNQFPGPAALTQSNLVYARVRYDCARIGYFVNTRLFVEMYLPDLRV